MHESLRAIFFDLDNTLLDHTGAARSAFAEIHGRYDLFSSIPLGRLFEQWIMVNDRYWHDYSAGLLTPAELKVGRLRALAAWACNETGTADAAAAQVEEMSRFYLDRLVAASAPYDGVIRLLEGLRGRYQLGIISNGFTEVQRGRLRLAALDAYFDHIILSEEVGAPKPDLRIFGAALESAGVAASESLYIGDNFLYDICGASRAGMATIWFNPDGLEHPATSSELRPGDIVRSIPDLARLLGVPFDLTSLS